MQNFYSSAYLSGSKNTLYQIIGNFQIHFLSLAKQFGTECTSSITNFPYIWNVFEIVQVILIQLTFFVYIRS